MLDGTHLETLKRSHPGLVMSSDVWRENSLKRPLRRGNSTKCQNVFACSMAKVSAAAVW